MESAAIATQCLSHMFQQNIFTNMYFFLSITPGDGSDNNNFDNNNNNNNNNNTPCES